MDYSEYTRQATRDVLTDADTSPGSALNDLMINPLASILSPFGLEQSVTLSNMSLLYPSGITSQDFDEIAANFLLTRNPGTRSRGYVRMYFSSAQTVTVPAGTQFSTTDGRNYYTEGAFSITRATMYLNNLEYPLYSTGDIYVVAESEGETYDCEAGEINEVTGIQYSPVKVRNPLPLRGGLGTETNQQFRDRLLLSSHNRSLASPNGIELTLKELFPSIIDVLVVGAGSEYMERDIIWSGITYPEIRWIDYYGKISGLNEYPYNRSEAYFSYFRDTDPTTEVSVPTSSSFTNEFSQHMYSRIFYSDSLYTEIEEEILIHEVFAGSGYSSEWVLSDGYLGYGRTYINEITVDTVEGAIKLGDDSRPTTVPIGATTIDAIWNILQPYDPEQEL